MLMPRGPRAWPIAGPGLAAPEGTRSLTCRRKDICWYIYVVDGSPLLLSLAEVGA